MKGNFLRISKKTVKTGNRNTFNIDGTAIAIQTDVDKIHFICPNCGENHKLSYDQMDSIYKNKTLIATPACTHAKKRFLIKLEDRPLSAIGFLLKKCLDLAVGEIIYIDNFNRLTLENSYNAHRKK